MREAWDMYLNGMKLIPGEWLTVDKQNGYMEYQSELDENNRLVIECCYWNNADRRHKLVAVSNKLYNDGKPVPGQYTGIDFYLYDNATRKMKIVYPDELDIALDTPNGTQFVTHDLPRQGRTMIYTYQIPSGKNIVRRLTWNGSKFIISDK